MDMEGVIWDSQHCTCHGSLPVAFSGVEGYQLALYEWAFIVHPFFLESSELSLELADYLGR